VILLKRTPGTPLSEAERRQRREAARARWRGHTRKLLSEREEKALVAAWRQGSRNAGDALVEFHMPLARGLARSYAGYGLGRDEIEAAAFEGLVHARRTFDPEKGARFATHASNWIRATLGELVQRQSGTTRLGSNKEDRKLFWRLRGEKARRGILGPVDADQAREIARDLKVRPASVQRMDARLGAFDQRFRVESDEDAGFDLPDPGDTPEMRVWRTQQRWLVERELRRMPARDRGIFLDRMADRPLRETAARHGVSVQRAHQIERRTLERLRERLGKRTPGTPLSEAERRQRRDAARARWDRARRTAEGAAAGVVAGGALGLGAEIVGQRRRMLNFAGVMGAETAKELDALRQSSRARLDARLAQIDRAVKTRGRATPPKSSARILDVLHGAPARPPPPVIGSAKNELVIDYALDRLGRQRKRLELNLSHYLDRDGFERRALTARESNRARSIERELGEVRASIKRLEERRRRGRTYVAPTRRSDGTRVAGHVKSTYRGGASRAGTTRKFIAALIGQEKKLLGERRERLVAGAQRAAEAVYRARRRALESELARRIGAASRESWRAGWRRAGRYAALGGLVGAGVAAWRGARAEPDDALRKAAPPDETERELAVRLARAFRRWIEELRSDGTPSRSRDDGLPSRHAAMGSRSPWKPRIEFEKDLQEALKPAEDAFVETLRRPDVEAGEGGRVVAFTFSMRNPEVKRHLDHYRMDLIRHITDEQRGAIRQTLAEGTYLGAPTEEMGRRVRESIGLTPLQAGHVTSFRRQLEALDPRALQRALRDRRFDRTLQRAIDTGAPLSAEQIDRMVDAYQRRYIALRAWTIARTEALRAVNHGNVAAARMQLAQMPDMTVIKRWIATKDERTRDTHRHLDGQAVIGLDAPFASTSGAMLRWPHDPDAPAAETVNCLLPGARVFAVDVVAASRREYRGEAVTIELVDGAELSCTPNHPILTARGWVAAQFLDPADHVVCASRSDWRAVCRDDQHAPPRIEDAERALNMVMPAGLKVLRGVDFHGEASDGDVCVVSINDRCLEAGIESALSQKISEDELGFSRLVEHLGASFRLAGVPVGILDAAADDGMSSAHLRLSAFLRHLAPLQHLSFTACPRSATVFAEKPIDCAPLEPGFVGDAVHRLLGIEPTEDLLVRVRSLRRFRYHGDVFNLETRGRLYIADGIVSHNCRCTMAFEIVPKATAIGRFLAQGVSSPT
jgi:RNA polymerase sigma factor (sigma-70 family)